MLTFIRPNSSASLLNSGLSLLRKSTLRPHKLILLQRARFYVTEAEHERQAPSTSKPPRLARLIKTLDPSKYVSVKQDLYDISGGRSLRFSPQGRHPFIFTICRFKFENALPPFPSGSKGALYYYQNPSLPPIAGEVRFRVFDSLRSEDFAEGHDLQARPGRPWALSLIRIARTPSYARLLQLIREEEMVDDALIEDIAKLPAEIQDRLNLFRLDQPFLVDLESYALTANLVTRTMIWKVSFQNLFSDRTDLSDRLVPYKGLAWVRFEVSDLPEHAKRGPCLILRFLQSLTPFTPSNEDYVGVVAMPQEGELLKRHVSLKSKKDPSVWHYPMQERKQGVKFKAFIAATTGQSSIH